MKTTEKQKTAILNLDAYLHSLSKTEHREEVKKLVENISAEEASKMIKNLIKEVSILDSELNSNIDVPNSF